MSDPTTSALSNRRVLVTGAAGFSGRHLVARLRSRRPAAIVGLDRTPATPATPLAVDDYLGCDLTDRRAVDRAVFRACPDVVFHLAGLFGSASADEIWNVNVCGFGHLCEALRNCRRDPGCPIRMVTVGSAAELGTAGAAELPVTEAAPCLPESPYGKSKLAATRLALEEPAGGPLRIVVARPFNLVGPGFAADLALGSFARQIVAVTRGEAAAVRCGALHPKRDFVDVRDAAEAYLALAEHGRPGEVYNVCSGRSCPIGDLLRQMIALAGGGVPVLEDRSRFRRGDLADVYGDRSKITRDTGWRPAIPIHRSLADLMASAGAACTPGVEIPLGPVAE